MFSNGWHVFVAIPTNAIICRYSNEWCCLRHYFDKWHCVLCYSNEWHVFIAIPINAIFVAIPTKFHHYSDERCITSLERRSSGSFSNFSKKLNYFSTKNVILTFLWENWAICRTDRYQPWSPIHKTPNQSQGLGLELLSMIYIQYIHHVQFQYHGVKTRALHSPPPWGQNWGVTIPSPFISTVLGALQNWTKLDVPITWNPPSPM